MAASAAWRRTCDEVHSACEFPPFPSWAGRYNRNQRLPRYEPWYIRDERMPPNYRNMGVHNDFRFHPLGPDEKPRPFQILGLNYCHDVAHGRVAGFGNSAIGHSPGPAPPRLVLYDVQAPFQADDLYKVNEINNITSGVSLIGPTPLGMTESEFLVMPLNPSHYLDQTLGQTVQVPGTFPYFNKSLPSLSNNAPMTCSMLKDKPLDPMEIWKRTYARQQAAHAHEKNCRSILFSDSR